MNNKVIFRCPSCKSEYHASMVVRVELESPNGRMDPPKPYPEKWEIEGEYEEFEKWMMSLRLNATTRAVVLRATRFNMPSAPEQYKWDGKEPYKDWFEREIKKENGGGVGSLYLVGPGRVEELRKATGNSFSLA